ncbi:MAG: LLM class flavin-dependent oxidoreductase [Pseudomonadales bacterium]|nr:LLM class flavin-dependent oxidoreductase [Pseudomonadales bacterium]
MTSENRFDCCIIGEGKLTLECAQLLLNCGHIIHGMVSTNADIKSWAKERDIPCIDSTEDQEAFFSQREFDYLFSIINPRKVSTTLLSMPKIGAINYHDAPLPKYAGLHVTTWAIQNQEQKFGVTWHEMVDQFDAGKILKQVEFAIEPDDSAFSLNIRCFQKGLETFAELIKELSENTVTRRPQDLSQRSAYLSTQRPASAAIIDWSASAAEIEALVRSLNYQTDNNPLGLPKVFISQSFYLITDVALKETNSSSNETATPGTILRIGESELDVSIGSGTITVKNLLTIDGEPVNLTKNSEIIEGSCFESLPKTKLDEIHTLDNTLARNEKYWKEALQNSEPFTFATHGAQPLTGTHHRTEQQSATLTSAQQELLAKEFPNLSVSDALAGLFCCFLRRMADAESFDIGLQSPEDNTLNSLYSARVPLNIAIDNKESIRTLTEKLAAKLTTTRSKKSYIRDLIPRTPSLSQVSFPVAIETVDDLSKGCDGANDTLVLTIKNNSTNYLWKYSPDSLSEESAQQIIQKFNFFLENSLAYLDAPLSQIYLVSEDEMKTILVDWNKTEKAVEQDTCIHQLFEQQAAQQPDAIALTFRNKTISYGQLNHKADQLASKLRQLGTQPDSLIGVFLERSIEMMIGLLAIHKAGAAYVPLDPAYPRDRIALMISDSEAHILLTHSKLENEIPSNDAKILCLDKEPYIKNELSGLPDTTEVADNHASIVTPSNLAYVIYTSGSTGKPKGVMVEHRNVINFMAGMDDTLDFQMGRDKPGTWLAVTSISFDISVLELFWTLTRGFKVVIQEEEARTLGGSQQGVSTVARKLDVGLFYFSSDAGPDTQNNRYKLLLEGAKFADTHQFSSIWTPERHFHLFGGLYPNPSVTSAAVAAITNNVAIRAGSIVLPLHNPIRVTEEWSVVDNISNGRVGFSFASGWHANDFALKPENYENRRQLMFDQIETVRKLWRGETVEVMNGEGQPFAAKVYPPPIQAEPPIWITTAGNIETFRQAGEGGFNILTNLLGQSIEDITEKITAYRAGRKANGYQGEGNVSVMVHTFIGTNVDEVREIVREPFCNYLKTSFDLVKIAPWSFPAFKQPSKAAAQDSSFDASSLTDEDMDALIDHAFERYFETAGIFGTPTSVLPLIDQLKSAGIDEIACLIDFGVDNDMVLESLHQLNKLRELSNPQDKISNSSNAQDYSIAAQIKNHGVTHFQCTPSMARILASDDETLSAMTTLQKVLLGGEALPADLASKLKQSLNGNLINVYGPTETTIWSTSGLVPNETNEIDNGLTIGRPIANTHIYILDSAQQPTPIGVPGELMIGGKGVVRGYHKRPDLTADRFIDNPLDIPHDPRIYRTGDLAKYRPNGEIEFLGRLDHQVKLRGYRIELGEIESLINAQPGVKESVVIAPESDQGTQSLLAYVVPNSHSQLPGATSHWQTLWDEAYKGTFADDTTINNDLIENDQIDNDSYHENKPTITDPTFNVSGWLDSYTGEQHDEEHMREWVDSTVDRILELKPKRVLEIGCGTGLMLYRVAPHCENYVGVDFSGSALNLIEEQVEKLGMNNVSLIQSAADTLPLDDNRLKDNGPFDLIVINSVIQYFPSASYLVGVINNLTSVLTPTGKLFIGDARSLALRDTFHQSLEVAKAAASVTVSELQERIQAHHDRESELLIDPDFFYHLHQEVPAIRHVGIQLKRGQYRNEMSAYRYDVVLQLSTPAVALTEADFTSLPTPTTLSALQASVEQASTQSHNNLVIRDIPNARLTKDFVTEAILASNSRIQLVSDLHNLVMENCRQAPEGIQPEAIYQLETPYRVALTWAKSGKKDGFDAYFFSQDENTQLQLSSLSNAASSGKPLSELCHEPAQQNTEFELADRLTDRLREKLPDFMVPSDFIMLTSMPLTPNGKINRKALPKPEKRQRVEKEAFVAPESDIEQTIAAVLQEMLNLEKIGTKDNFFSLGANSLLIAQANNRLCQRLNRQVSLVAMYRFPTIAKLADHLSGKTDNKQSADKGAKRGAKRKEAMGARRRRMRKK